MSSITPQQNQGNDMSDPLRQAPAILYVDDEANALKYFQRAISPLAPVITAESVEEGKRLHVSIGQGSPVSPSSAASLAGLSTLERIANLSIISDRPPVAFQCKQILLFLREQLF